MIEGVGERQPDGKPLRVVVGGGRHVRTRSITCNERSCDAFTVAHLVKLLKLKFPFWAFKALLLRFWAI